MDPDKVWSEANSLVKKRKEWDEGKYMPNTLIEDFTEEMRKQHPHIATSDKIFYKCINKDMNMNQLKEMLSYLRQIKKGRSKEAVDKQVGQMMADRYVKPLVDKLDKEKAEKEKGAKIEELD